MRVEVSSKTQKKNAIIANKNLETRGMEQSAQNALYYLLSITELSIHLVTINYLAKTRQNKQKTKLGTLENKKKKERKYQTNTIYTNRKVNSVLRLEYVDNYTSE